MKKIPIITIQGPTGVGKSHVALELAKELNSEIISADSRQIYKLMDIGTAKPNVDELIAVKHHLIDIIYPNQEYSAGKFINDATIIAKDIYSRGKLPIIAGGTGFYVKSLLSGLFKSPSIPTNIREKLRKEAETKPNEYFYDYLKKIDPANAIKTNVNDLQRILRFIEVYETTKTPISQLWEEQQRTNPFKSYNILLTMDRKYLYEKINNRIMNMIKNGLITEIKKILSMGYTKDAHGMSAVGYKEFIPYIEGDLVLEDAIWLAQKNTRNYAKRQFTWYRKNEFDLTIDVNEIRFSDIMKKIYDKCRLFGV